MAGHIKTILNCSDTERPPAQRNLAVMKFWIRQFVFAAELPFHQWVMGKVVARLILDSTVSHPGFQFRTILVIFWFVKSPIR
jgi:hypothetical protein